MRLIAEAREHGGKHLGPIEISGEGTFAYDAGMLFVSTGGASLCGVLTAVDAATGTQKWSAIQGGAYNGTTPIGQQGLVYGLLVAPAGSTVTAFVLSANP